MAPRASRRAVAGREGARAAAREGAAKAPSATESETAKRLELQWLQESAPLLTERTSTSGCGGARRARPARRRTPPRAGAMRPRAARAAMAPTAPMPPRGGPSRRTCRKWCAPWSRYRRRLEPLGTRAAPLGVAAENGACRRSLRPVRRRAAMAPGRWAQARRGRRPWSHLYRFGPRPGLQTGACCKEARATAPAPVAPTTMAPAPMAPASPETTRDPREAQR
jgi:hypothetical protein